MMISISAPSALSLRAKLFRGFADSSRLAILDTLRDGSLTVGEIALDTGLSQSNTSNHLACLHDCGLVTREQRGKFVEYSLADEKVGLLLSLADEVLAEVASGVYACTRYNTPETTP